jgi:predicted permease
MKQQAGMMPEARYRSTKRRVQPSQTGTQTRQENARPAKKAVQKAEGAVARQRKFSLFSCWPVAVGLLLSCYVAEWQQTMTAAIGLWGMRLAFPLTLLATHREIGLDDQMAAVLPQIALYVQLPLEGLLTMATLGRGRSLKSAIALLICIHAVSAFVLWLVSFGS